MPDQTARLRISTPTEPIQPGRGFYQLEEDALYVQIGVFTARRHFYSYLEGEKIRFDLDRTGRLIFFELTLPRRRWPVEDNLTPPKIVEPADIRWLDFRTTIAEPRLHTNEKQTVVRLLFSETPPARNYYLAKDVLLSVDDRDNLVAIWVCDIVDDLAGQEIGAFRKKHRSNESFFS